MKFKHLLILFAVGMSISGIGALMKIMSWPYGNELLLVSTIVQTIALIGFVVKLIIFKDIDSILNK